jgi:hypothetical protein
MDAPQVIERLRSCNRAAVSRDTGINVTYLYRVVKGLIKNPGSQQIDRLREYFERVERPVQ